MTFQILNEFKLSNLSFALNIQLKKIAVIRQKKIMGFNEAKELMATHKHNLCNYYLYLYLLNCFVHNFTL